MPQPLGTFPSPAASLRADCEENPRAPEAQVDWPSCSCKARLAKRAALSALDWDGVMDSSEGPRQEPRKYKVRVGGPCFSAGAPQPCPWQAGVQVGFVLFRPARPGCVKDSPSCERTSFERSLFYLLARSELTWQTLSLPS